MRNLLTLSTLFLIFSLSNAQWSLEIGNPRVSNTINLFSLRGSGHNIHASVSYIPKTYGITIGYIRTKFDQSRADRYYYASGVGNWSLTRNGRVAVQASTGYTFLGEEFLQKHLNTNSYNGNHMVHAGVKPIFRLNKHFSVTTDLSIHYNLSQNKERLPNGFLTRSTAFPHQYSLGLRYSFGGNGLMKVH
jgi:hypothetical protein